MKKNNYLVLAISFVVFLFGLPAFASAATVLHFETPNASIVAGNVFTIKALIDADQPLNAYDLTIAYQGPVTVRAVNDADSIITVWQGQPAAQDGIITLRGGSISPFSGSGGELATIYVSAEASGAATFSFINSTAYVADGKGTTVTPETIPMTIAIAAAGAGAAASPNVGSSSTLAALGVPETTPQILFLGIVRDPSSGKEILSFLANDAGSGIAGTFVRYRTMFAWGPWQPAINYAIVPSNAWEVGFLVTNNEGVSAERTLYDGTNLVILIGELIGGLLVIACAIAIWIWRRRRHFLTG